MFDKTRLAVDQGRRINGESPASTELRTGGGGGGCTLVYRPDGARQVFRRACVSARVTVVTCRVIN